MPPNRGHRGRGRGGFKPQNVRLTPQEKAVMNRTGNIKDRLGNMQTYGKTQTSKRYRTATSVAELPQESEVRETAKNFIKTYYNIFDSERGNLGSQYSEDAIFSYSATNPFSNKGRNLLEVHEAAERLQLLITGRTIIAQTLSSFPGTEHPVSLLSCDVPYYIVNPMFITSLQIIVTGVYKDLTPDHINPLVAFTRVFVIKQVSVDNDGKPVYEIFNDLFMLQPPTPGQIKNYHNNAQIVNRVSGNQTQRQNVSAEDAPTKLKEEMIRSIMSKTKMNRAGSEKLLNDFQWNEQVALENFKALFEIGQLPQSLFT